MQQPSKEQLEAWDRRHVWHAFTQMAEYEPLLFERGFGRTLVDIEGREYLDATGSLWCNVHGHRHPRLDQALRDQLDRIAHTTSLGASNSTTVRLARRLVELAPAGLNHVFFSDDGATSVEVALKMAFQYWQQCPSPRPEKTAYVALSHAYHGDTLGCVSVGGVARFHAAFSPLLFHVLRLEAPDLYRLPRGVTRENALDWYVSQAEALLKAEHARIAALVIEPLVQAAAGMLVHPAGYLRALRELTQKYDVLLIADEVAVGFGRTGTLFACEQELVTPDFLCLAKGLSGGYLPVAATLATTRIWEAFLGKPAESRQFFHGHTFGGNPLGAAVALASLDVFQEERVLEQLNDKSTRLRELLARIATLDHVGDVRQRGLLAGVELVRDRATGEPYPWHEQRAARACRMARESNVLLRPLGDVIPIVPALSVTLEELDRMLEAAYNGIHLATRDGA